ncbi:MAG: hypothetical protein ACTSX6_03340 [Candidatus Heimdallarchaeaceae archaeon]
MKREEKIKYGLLGGIFVLSLLILVGVSFSTTKIYQNSINTTTFYEDGVSLTDKYVEISDKINWSKLQYFPTYCPSGQYVSGINSTLQCSTPPGGTDTNCSTDMSCPNILYDSEVINSTANKSIYWNDYRYPTDLNNKLTLSCSNITGSTSDLCTIVDSDTNCSADNSCSLITYDSETSSWDKDSSDDLTKSTSFSGGVYGTYNSLWVSTMNWTKLRNYPTYCSSGQFVRGINDTLVCASPPGATDTNCSADGSCPLITYDSETSSWDKDTSNDLTTSTNFGGDVSGTYNAIEVSDNSHLHDWTNITNKPTNLDTDSTDDFLKDGSVAMTGNFNAGGNDLININRIGIRTSTISPTALIDVLGNNAKDVLIRNDSGDSPNLVIRAGRGEVKIRKENSSRAYFDVKDTSSHSIMDWINSDANYNITLYLNSIKVVDELNRLYGTKIYEENVLIQNKYLNLSGDTMTGNLNMGGNEILDSGNIIPQTNNTKLVGNSSNTFNKIYSTQLCLSADCSHRIYFNGTHTIIE